MYSYLDIDVEDVQYVKNKISALPLFRFTLANIVSFKMVQ